jgi:hypothetical protein
MISVILYGRNDSYGYNLHKRAALSLNCIAELLNHEDDEIVFVDYNTPDDFPTFPEAIQDTLTPRARRLLRILRVRPKHHQRFKERTHLVALEPIARNVAVRRSNPANRWILSTNTDMIFVPRKGQSLSEIAADLPDGYYHLPRFEIPESLWESLDRSDPTGTIARIDAWGRTFHLNEIVHAHDPWVKYDGPGDFQLMLREDLFRISGFHEDMLLGWHVDSNIARRLYLLHGKIGDVLNELFGYHCDHTRQVTPAHRSGSAQNDIVKFNDEVKRPFVPEQADSWGLASEVIEELTADRTSSLYVNGLTAAITREMSEPTHATYDGNNFDQVDYDVPHVLPFVTDILASYPRDTRIGWFGSRRELLDAFAEAAQRMQFTENVMVAAGTDWLGKDLPPACVWTLPTEIYERADVLVFDCALLQDGAAGTGEQASQISRFMANSFRNAANFEMRRCVQANTLPRRFIGVNVIHNRFEGLITSYLATARSPMASRIRQGFVMPRGGKASTDLTPLFSIGPAGHREDGRIVAVPGQAGFIIYGAYQSLDTLQYRLNLTFQPIAATGSHHAGAVVLEIVAEPYILAAPSIELADLRRGSKSIAFTVAEQLIDLAPWSRVEFRLHTDGSLPITLLSATLEQVAAAEPIEPEYDLLPLMTSRGVIGKITARRVARALFGKGRNPVRTVANVLGRMKIGGPIVYGPYIALPLGHYRATFRLRTSIALPTLRAKQGRGVLLEVYRHRDNVQLAHRHVALPMHGTSEHTLDFEIRTEADSHEIELRVMSPGGSLVKVEMVRVRRLGDLKQAPKVAEHPGTTPALAGAEVASSS